MEDLRKEIDKLDDQIIALLDKRLDIVKQVKEYKKQHNIQVLDKSREEQILNKLCSCNNRNELDNIYRHIMNVSKSMQEE